MLEWEKYTNLLTTRMSGSSFWTLAKNNPSMARSLGETWIFIFCKNNKKIDQIEG